jgi:16S rRNA processing protein RimM
MVSKQLEIGVLARAHGVRGQLRVRLYDAGSTALEHVERVLVDGEERRVERAARERDGYLLKLAGVDDRDAAEALRGRALAVFRDDVPPPGDDELYLADLVGCEVVDAAGEPLGTVAEVRPGGGQDLLVLARDGLEVLVPFVEPIVVAVDLAARRIVCDPPEGLLDEELHR